MCGQTRRVLLLKNLLHAVTMAAYWIKNKLTQYITVPYKKIKVKAENWQWLNARILRQNIAKYPVNFPIHACISNKSRINNWIFT
jgi:hypothetical protein